MNCIIQSEVHACKLNLSGLVLLIVERLNMFLYWKKNWLFPHLFDDPGFFKSMTWTYLDSSVYSHSGTSGRL